MDARDFSGDHLEGADSWLERDLPRRQDCLPAEAYMRRTSTVTCWRAIWRKVLDLGPEASSINPGAVRKLIEILKQHPQHQFIVTTHSPEVITASNPTTLTLLHKQDAETVVERLDVLEAQELRAVLAPGRSNASCCGRSATTAKRGSAVAARQNRPQAQRRRQQAERPTAPERAEEERQAHTHGSVSMSKQSRQSHTALLDVSRGCSGWMVHLCLRCGRRVRGLLGQAGE